MIQKKNLMINNHLNKTTSHICVVANRAKIYPTKEQGLVH